jgi:predicted phosphoribosyltransferase
MEFAREPRAPTPYRDRRQAGAALADNLSHYRNRDDLAALALPRGGVPVADEVARALQAPLDIFVVRKLGAPGHEELAMGAIASGGVRVLNEDTIHWYRLSAAAIDEVARRELAELERRERVYRQGRPLIDVSGRTVILVDDGLATGATMHAAVLAARRLDPSRIVVAVPVGARESCVALAAVADEVVCPLVPPSLSAVGLWYEDFSQTTDEEVRDILDGYVHRVHAETSDG